MLHDRPYRDGTLLGETRLVEKRELPRVMFTVTETIVAWLSGKEGCPYRHRVLEERQGGALRCRTCRCHRASTRRIPRSPWLVYAVARDEEPCLLEGDAKRLEVLGPQHMVLTGADDSL